MMEGIGSGSWAWMARINGLYSYDNMVLVYQTSALEVLGSSIPDSSHGSCQCGCGLFKGLFSERDG